LYVAILDFEEGLSLVDVDHGACDAEWKISFDAVQCGCSSLSLTLSASPFLESVNLPQFFE
jgi:hypothetical protein